MQEILDLAEPRVIAGQKRLNTGSLSRRRHKALCQPFDRNEVDWSGESVVQSNAGDKEGCAAISIVTVVVVLRLG